MQLLCILSKSHFQFGIKWKDYALQYLEESICIFGPIDYRLLKIYMNLKQLSAYTFFFFFFLMHCILQRPVFIASANTVKVCKCKSQPPNRNHMAQCKPCAYAGVHLLCWAHHYSSVTCTSKSSCTKNESEIYSTSTTPLKLPVSLLSLGQPPFRATLREYLREQLPRRKSRPSPS